MTNINSRVEHPKISQSRVSPSMSIARQSTAEQRIRPKCKIFSKFLRLIHQMGWWANQTYTSLPSKKFASSHQETLWYMTRNKLTYGEECWRLPSKGLTINYIDNFIHTRPLMMISYSPIKPWLGVTSLYSSSGRWGRGSIEIPLLAAKLNLA